MFLENAASAGISTTTKRAAIGGRLCVEGKMIRSLSAKGSELHTGGGDVVFVSCRLEFEREKIFTGVHNNYYKQVRCHPNENGFTVLQKIHNCSASKSVRDF